MKMHSSDEKGKNKEDKPQLARNATGLQKMKLEKLMKNPDKPVIIPDRQKDKKFPHVPDFVRNVMGSSAGAGSGEFHVYRHLRRKEYARQKIIHEKAERSVLDVEYQKKLEDNKQEATNRTAKKRAKRLRQKDKLKKKKLAKPTARTQNDTDGTNSDSSEQSDIEDERSSDRLENQQPTEQEDKTASKKHHSEESELIVESE